MGSGNVELTVLSLHDGQKPAMKEISEEISGNRPERKEGIISLLSDRLLSI